MRAHDGTGSGPGASTGPVHGGREGPMLDARRLSAEPEQALAPELE